MLTYMGGIIPVRPPSKTRESRLIESVVVNISKLPGGVVLRLILVFKTLRVTLSLEESRGERVLRRRSVESI